MKLNFKEKSALVFQKARRYLQAKKPIDIKNSWAAVGNFMNIHPFLLGVWVVFRVQKQIVYFARHL